MRWLCRLGRGGLGRVEGVMLGWCAIVAVVVKAASGSNPAGQELLQQHAILVDRRIFGRYL